MNKIDYVHISQLIHYRFLNLLYGSENSLNSFRSIVATLANRLHPWWDEGAGQVKLRLDNPEGVYQDRKLQVSQGAALGLN